MPFSPVEKNWRSQREMIVLENGKEDSAKKIFDKWNLDFAVIGKTTATKNIELFFNNEQVAKIPVNTLKKLFDFGYHTRKINVIFSRVLNKR